MRKRAHGAKLDIPVGTRLTLSFLNQKESYPAELLGYSAYEFLILRLPRLPALRSRLIANETLSLRFIHDGTVFGFITEVITTTVRPAFMLFCTFPDSLEQIDLRRHQRLNCLLPAVAHTSIGEYRCILQDLSHGGAKLVFETKSTDALRQIEAGTNILLDFTLFVGESEVPVPSVVRSVSLDGLKMYMGIQFLDLPDRLRKEMADYIDAVCHLR